MYISRIKIDPLKRKSSVALRDRSLLHSAVENTIEGERPHNMWRLEPDMSLLIVSKEIPYLGDIQEMYGMRAVKPETKEYDGHVDSIKEGDILRFRVEVNPVKNIRVPGKKNGADVPLNLTRTERYPFCADDWALEKLEESGGLVLDIRRASHDTVYFTKKGKRIPLLTVTYTGLMKVKDAEAVKKALRAGVGGKKAYGCGMLTVVPDGRKIC